MFEPSGLSSSSQNPLLHTTLIDRRLARVLIASRVWERRPTGPRSEQLNPSDPNPGQDSISISRPSNYTVVTDIFENNELITGGGAAPKDASGMEGAQNFKCIRCHTPPSSSHSPHVSDNHWHSKRFSFTCLSEVNGGRANIGGRI